MTRSNQLRVTRSKLLRTTPLAGGFLAGICLMASPAHADPAVDALPGGMSVGSQNGGDTITNNVNGGTDTMTVSLGNNTNTILNWASYSIGANATVNYTVGFATPGAVLNRVTGLTVSEIYGELTGPDNLSIFVINPNGLVFGPNSTVDVGSFFASTLDLTDADFLNGSPFNFTGTATTGVTVLADGADLASITSRFGPVVLLGGFVNSAGTISATTDVVMAAASDVSLTVAPGSPISMTINQGTPVSGGVVAGGTVSGQNVYLALASRTGVLDALLSVTGTVTATTVEATDRGIVLAAGASATGVTVASGGGADTTGVVGVSLTGSLNALDDENGDPANVEIRANGNITGSGTINSDDLVLMTSGGNVQLTSTDAIDAGDGIDIGATGTIEIKNADTANGDLKLSAANLTFNASTLRAQSGNVDLTGVGTASGLSTITAADTGATVTFNSTIDGAGSLAVTSVAGTTFEGSVGGTTALTNISVVGPARLDGGVMRATDGISTENLTVGFAGAASIDADSDNNGTGSLLIDGNLAAAAPATSSVTLGGTQITVDSVTGFVDVSFDDATQLNGNVTASDDVAFSAGLTLAGGGADQTISGDSVSFGAINGASDLTVTAANGITFNGVVGGVTALRSLDVQGNALVTSGGITTTNGLTVDGLTLSAASVTLEGGTAFTASGDIDGAVAGATALTIGGNATSVGNVGKNVSFASVRFLDDLTLSGDITATGLVRTDGDLVLTGTGVRTITGGSVTLGDAPADDISSAVDKQTGLAVVANDLSVTGTGATFSGEIGTVTPGNTPDNTLASFGVSAKTFTALSSVRAEVLAINVQTGNITLLSDQDLNIGTVGPVIGLSTNGGNISVTTTGPNSDLFVNGQVRASGTVALTAGGDLSGTAAITSGFGVLSSADITLSAGGDLSVGNVSSDDDITIVSGGTTTAGTLSSGNGDDGEALLLPAQQGADVRITANGIEVGAISIAATTTTSDIVLDGGTGVIGNELLDLSLFSPGTITLIGNAVGVDIALNASGAISTGNLTARDDVAVWSTGGGSVTTGNVTSGATINGELPVDVNGAAEALFPGLDQAGNDISIAGTVLSFGTLAALGTGSDVRIDDLGGNAIGAGTRDLSIQAGGGIQLFDAAKGRDIALQAGGSISAVGLSARDDIAVIAGTTASLGAIAAGTTVDALVPLNVNGAADPLLPSAFDATGNDLFLQAQEVTATYSLTGIDDFGLVDTQGDLTLPAAITSSGTLILTAQNGNMFVNAALSSTNEDVILTASGALTINAAVTANGAGATINATAGTGDLSINAGLSATGTNGDIFGTSTSGDVVVGAVTLQADRSINLSAPAATGDIFLNGSILTTPTGGGKSVVLNAGNDIIQTGGAITTNTLDGAAGRDAIVKSPSNNIGNLSLTAGRTLGIYSSTGFNITDDLSGGGFDLETPQFITIAANITSTGPIVLTAGTIISQTGGTITGTSLSGSSGGSTTLNGANNDVDTLGPFTANGFSFTDVDGLAITGAINSGTGPLTVTAGGALTVGATLTSNAGAIALNANGDLGVNAAVTSNNGAITFNANGEGSDIAIAAPVNAGTGTLTLNADGNLSQTAAGVLTAGTLIGDVTGTANLGAVANNIATLGAFSANGFTLLDAGGLTVSGPVNGGAGGVNVKTSGTIAVTGAVSATNGPITLEATGAGSNISLAGAVNAGTGTVTLLANGTGGAISQTAAGPITAGTLTGGSSGATTLTAATNHISTLGAYASNGFSLTNGNALTVTGPVAAGTGALSINNTGLLTLNGNLTEVGVSLSGTGITQASSSTVNAGTGALSLTGTTGLVTVNGTLTGTGVTVAGTGVAQGASSTINAGGALLTINGNTGPVTVDGALTGTGVTITGAAITQAATGTVAAGSGALTVTGTGAVAINGAMSGTGATISGTTITQGTGSTINAGSGALAMNGSGQVTINGNLTGTGVSLTGVGVTTAAGTTVAAGTGALTVTGNGPVVLNGALTGTGATITGTTITQGAGGSVNAGSGALTVNGSGLLTVNGNLTGTGVSLTGAGITQGSASVINAGGGTMLLDGNDGAIALSGTLTTTNAGATALVIRDASSLALGTVNAGSGTVTLGGAGTDNIAGAITQTGALSAATLTGNAGGAVTLANAGNQIATVSGFTSNGFTLNDAGGGLTVTGAIAAGSGPLSLTTGAGNLGIGANLSTTGAITLNAPGGTVTQTAGTIVGGSLGGTSSGGATLTAAGNSFATLTGWTNSGAGGLTLVDSVGLTITGNVNAGTGLLSITAPGINFTGRTLTAGGNVTLAAGTGALVGGTVTAGGGIVGTGASIDIGTVAANGGALDLNAGATGTLKIGTGTASTTTTLVGGLVDIGSLNGGTTVTIDARDLAIATALNATQTVTIRNTGTGTATNLGSATGTGMTINGAEFAAIHAPTVNIQSVANALNIGDLAIGALTGATRLNLMTTGTITVTGEVSASGARTIQLGGSAADTGQSQVINVITTTSGGGRLLMPAATLNLRGARIMVGQEAMIDELGGMALNDVFSEIGDAQSEIYRPTNGAGVPSYYDPGPTGAQTLVSAQTLNVTYNDYAIFQNTALPGSIPAGVVIGSTASPTGTLTLNSSGNGGANGFSLSGEINGRRGIETAVLGPNFIVLNGVNLNNSRLNGCLVGSGANCIINIVATPTFDLFDEGRADVLSAGRDLTLTLDPVLGANNEALFSGAATLDDGNEECENGPDGDKTQCPAEEETKQ